MPNKQKKQNKIAWKRHKQNWLLKKVHVGVDSQFEGLEGSGLNNRFEQVIPVPEGGSVWVKR